MLLNRTRSILVRTAAAEPDDSNNDEKWEKIILESQEEDGMKSIDKATDC